MLILAMRERHFEALRDYGEEGHMGESHCLRRATREFIPRSDIDMHGAM